MKSADTIFAMGSGSGKAAVKVFRISGAGTGAAMAALGLDALPPRVASLRKLRDPRSSEEIDTGLVIWFPGPASFTGEDCLELQLHGGRAVERAALGALSAIPGLRLAEPGEFAWRAFLNRKLDLTAIEGLADLIDAETDLQRRQALGQTHGRLFEAAGKWRDALLSCLALVEGEIDFEDESDAPKGIAAQVVGVAAQVRGELAEALRDFARAEVTRNGFCVVILGPPNVGKSSLLNYIIDREAAIVASTPGTTRDLIEATLDLDGAPIVIVDTAGVRESREEVEQIGIDRALARAASAQLVLWLEPEPGAVAPGQGIETTAPMLRLRSKSDLQQYRDGADLAVSTVTGEGVKELLDEIAARAHAFLDGRPPSLTNARHVCAASLACEALDRLARRSPDLELMAEELRAAAMRLETLFGRIDSEEVLGHIFARFCIGK